MTNLDNIIRDIEEVNATYDFWIRDKNGQIKEDVICADIIPFLKDLKEYEIDIPQDTVVAMRNEALELDTAEHGNSYNWNANVDHDFEFSIVRESDDSVVFYISVHRFGDVRGNYTDYAVCKFDNEFELWELDSTIQCKTFNDRYIADINIWFDTYSVYDTETCETYYEIYDIEVEDALETIRKMQEEVDK